MPRTDQTTNLSSRFKIPNPVSNIPRIINLHLPSQHLRHYPPNPLHHLRSPQHRLYPLKSHSHESRPLSLHNFSVTPHHPIPSFEIISNTFPHTPTHSSNSPLSTLSCHGSTHRYKGTITQHSRHLLVVMSRGPIMLPRTCRVQEGF